MQEHRIILQVRRRLDFAFTEGFRSS